MILYLIKSTLCLAVFLVVYQWLLSWSRNFQFNRFFLLLGICFSLTIPFVEIEPKQEVLSDEVPVMMEISNFESQIALLENPKTPTESQAKVANSSVNSAINFKLVVLSIYLIGVMLMLLKYIHNIGALYRRVRTTAIVYYDNIRLNLVEGSTSPYSFLNYIFVSKKDYKEGISDQLLIHELTHVNQKHTWDILFVEFVKSILWFNPMLYLYAKVIRTNHEYLADDAVIGVHKNISNYQHQLLTFLVRSKPSGIASYLNYSITKKRFKMMKRNISKTVSALSMLAVVPVVLFAILAFSSNTDDTDKIPVVSVQPLSNIVEVINEFQEDNIPNILPIDESNLTRFSRGYGLRINPVTKQRDNHNGIDFIAEKGTPVKATANGVIEFVGLNVKDSMGLHIVIKHNAEYQTIYAHLNEVKVAINGEVKKGDIIGTVGNSGISRGYHLHYEVSKNGEKVDPKDYLPLDTPSVDQTKKSHKERRARLLDSKSLKKYNLKKNNQAILYSLDNFKYEKIVYDDSIAIFFYSDSQKVTFREMNKFSIAQIDAIESLTFPPMKGIRPRSITADIEASWADSSKYGIWINGVRVQNTEMKNYTALDFYHYWQSGLTKTAKNYGQHLFQLNLYTKAYYDKIFETDTYGQRLKEWRKTTEELLSVIEK